ncbi:hypothetical protein SUGI_0232470 [Cryptomeria japonica]|nr:hypothetical protein SUGI_0232470 [Cryptomeria japonica]
MPTGISKLASLRTLRSRWLDLSNKVDEFMTLEDLANMTQLQELWLNINHEMELRRMEEGILVQLTKMRHLRISLNMTGQFPQFPEQTRAMRDLESLTLYRSPHFLCMTCIYRIGIVHVNFDLLN